MINTIINNLVSFKSNYSYEKKQFYFFLPLLFLALILVSCEKDVAPDPGMNQQASNHVKAIIQPEDYDPSDEEAELLINQFLIDVKNPASISMNKNNGVRQFEIGMWLLEASLNAQYGDAASPFDRVVAKSTEFQFRAELQGPHYYLDYADMMAKFIDMSNECQDHHSKVLDSCISKHVIAVDLEVLTEIDPKTQVKIFTVKMTTLTGLLVSLHPICDWAPGTYLPAFDFNNAPNAADEIEQAINRCYFKDNCKYYTNILSPPLEPNGMIGNQPNNIYLETYPFPNYSWSSSAPHMLNDGQIRYFRDLYASVTIPSWILGGYAFISVDISGDYCLCSGNWAGRGFHILKIMQGKCRTGGFQQQ